MLLKSSFICICFTLCLFFGASRVCLADSIPVSLEHKLFDAIGQDARGEDTVVSVQTLIKRGVNVNTIENREFGQGQTPLMLAAEFGETPIVEALLSAGAKVNAQNRVKYSVGMTPLMWAAMGHGTDKIGVINLLLHHGANPEAREENGRSALMWACGEGSSENITALVKGGAKVNAANKFGETALTYAAANGRFDNFDALIHSGADVNVKENDGITPLMAAIIVPYVDHKSEGFAAAQTEQAEAVKMLLSSGANVKAVDSKHMTPLAYAIKENEPLVIDLLHAAGAKK